MKKSFFIKTLGLALTLGSLTSCNDYLATDPEDFVAPETYYNNEAQLTSALMGIYTKLGNTINQGGSAEESTYSRFLSLEAPSATDEMLARSNSAVAVSSYSFDSSYPQIVNCWTNLYQGIDRANLLLERLDQANTSQEVKDQIRGEALFLRGYYYFLLVGYWGDVPLKLTSTTSVNNVNIARTPAREVYAQIIKDMADAEPLLKNGAEWGNSGRISKTGCQGVLARVNLYAAGRLGETDKYVAARDWAKKVIDSGQHALNPSYSQIFKNECADVYDLQECIWEVEFNGNAIGAIYREASRFGSTLGVRNDDETRGYMQGLYVATGTQYSRYNAADLRRDWNIASYYYAGYDASRGPTTYAPTYVWGRYINKWRRDSETLRPFNKNLGPTNWPLLRYADVLLMYAEAENEVNGGPTPAAILAVNQVRRRAYGFPLGTPATTSDLTTANTASKDAFLTFLKEERARELAFEGWRKLDLLRWGTFLTVMKGMIPIITAQAPSSSNAALGYYGRTATLLPYQNVSERDVLWPIPSNEMALNQAMTQNDGWN